MMKTNPEKTRSRSAKWGWGTLLGVSALLLLAGISWYALLPQMALENIAEYAGLQPDDFKEGTPSSFDVITIISRGYGVGYSGLGLLALLVAFEGYRHGTRWAWTAMWVPVLAFVFLGGVFIQAGESFALSFGVLSIAGLGLIGLLLARGDLASSRRASGEAAGFAAE
jgi:hypothetical protein